MVKHNTLHFGTQSSPSEQCLTELQIHQVSAKACCLLLPELKCHYVNKNGPLGDMLSFHFSSVCSVA